MARGAEAADAVIHLGFMHDWSKFKESCEIDQRAIETIGAALAGGKKPLIVAAGTAGIAAPGRLATETDELGKDFPLPRVSEQTALALAAKGINASVMRLPQVHDTVKQGLVTLLVEIARQKGVSAYVGDGQNTWAAAHVSDVARLYRLALERHESGARYHAVAEVGVKMRDIAETIGQGLEVPMKSLSQEEAGEHFGFLGMFVGSDLVASSEITRAKLGWNPAGPGLIEDLKAMNYSVAVTGAR